LGGQEAAKHADQWLEAEAQRIAQFRHQLARAQNTAVPSVAMLAELASQVRMLLAR